MDRENGFYWVKYEGSDWQVAEWDGTQHRPAWWLVGSDIPETTLDEIDEHRLNPPT